MRKIILLFFPLLAAWGSLLAQEDLSTHFMRHTWQANRTNPAFFPDYKFVVGLPGFYNSLRVSNITYNDIVVQNSSGENVLDPASGIAALDATDNIIRENLDIETLALGFRLGKLGISLGHAARFNAFLNYPKALPQLIWEGNAQFIGQTVGFAPDVDLFSYQEFSLGLMYDLTDNFSIGGRFKLLSGLNAVNSSGNKLELTTSDDVYQLSLDADYTANSAGSIDYSGFEDVSVNFDFGTVDFDRLFTKNTGVSFDLGARFAFDKFEVTASVIDLGASIDWDDEVNNYSLQGNYEFKGLDFAEAILEDSTEFGSILDTLEAQYEITETSNAFSTTLPTRFYLSAHYQLRSNWSVGALFYSENYREEIYPAVAIGTSFDVLPFLNIGGLYAFRSGTFDNLGINATVKLGPVQLLAATDNIFTAIQPKDSNAANLRVGLNLLLNKVSAHEGGSSGGSFY
jgi:hypothetical protein